MGVGNARSHQSLRYRRGPQRDYAEGVLPTLWQPLVMGPGTRGLVRWEERRLMLGTSGGLGRMGIPSLAWRSCR